MSRYIDAENLKSIKSIQSADFNTIETIREWIDAQPTADVVDVVRCKDCEHGQSYNMFGSRYCLKHNDVAVRDNDFCSYGDKKNG